MEHLEIKSAELWLTKSESSETYTRWEFGKTKARAELAISAEKQRELKILNGTASFTPLDIARKQPAFIDVWSADTAETKKRMSKLDAEEKKSLAQKGGHRSYQLFTRIEQAPNPDSRVTLDAATDALGVPRAMLHWVLTPLEKRSIREIYKLIGTGIGHNKKRSRKADGIPPR